MLRFLFPRLTAPQNRGQPLFDSAVGEARLAHWYMEGGVPDTIDGRFAMLTTICALLTIRVEMLAEAPEAQSAALAERFVDAMDAEHRQLGINDPTLGKQVRKMVGSLARRVGQWRAATLDEGQWDAIVRSSVYGAEPATAEQLGHASARLRDLWRRFRASPDADIIEGKY